MPVMDGYEATLQILAIHRLFLQVIVEKKQDSTKKRKRLPAAAGSGESS